MERSTNTAAVVSLVCGILAWSALPVLGSLVAIVAGHGALRQIRASGGLETGEGMALAGLVLGWIQIGLLLLAAAGWLLILLLAGLFSGLTLIALVAFGLVLFAGLLGLLAMLGFGIG